MVPQENPEKLGADVAVIARWLSQQTGAAVSGFVTSDHAAAVEALRGGNADISFMGALPYVIAHREAGAEVLLAEVYRGQPGYRGRVFVRRDRGIARLEQLRGRSIAFADPVSESGYLYPLETFVSAGLLARGADPRSFFGEVYFAGGYQQAIQAAVEGLVDAAGASEFADLLLTRDQQPRITWIAESEMIPSHTVIARRGLDPDLRERFVTAMLKLNEAENRYLLQYVYGPDGYIRAEHAMYAPVEALALQYGLLR
jgi:phosphonate transport system substrate-binding protein